MNIELVAQMFKNYQSNVLFHLEGKFGLTRFPDGLHLLMVPATDNLKDPA